MTLLLTSITQLQAIKYIRAAGDVLVISSYSMNIIIAIIIIIIIIIAGEDIASYQ